jgi:hypothetical protein
LQDQGVIMLKKLGLANFKSFSSDMEWIPLAPVTILVGANASGKSNALDAVRFLQGVGMELSIAEILTGKWEGGREVYPGLRGGAGEVCWGSEETFTVATELTRACEGERLRDHEKGIPVKGISRCFKHEITCRAKQRPALISESLDVSDERGDERLVEITPESVVKPQLFELTQSRPRSALAEVIHQVNVDVKTRGLAGFLLDDYANARFLDVRPSLMKDYVSSVADDIGQHGENLSAIVRQICRTDQGEQYLDWLKELCAPEVTDIDFDRTATDKVMVRLVEGDGEKKPISAESLSDGTLRFMGILAAMFSAPEGSLFLMEEIENGLHPTRVHLLVELLEQFAEARHLQIIATTHSSQVLLGGWSDRYDYEGGRDFRAPQARSVYHQAGC